MEGKKIGIMTFWETQDNYGQVLQAYALQTFLRNQGYSPYLIRYSLFGDFVGYKGRWKSVLNPAKITKFIHKLIKRSQPNEWQTTKVDRKFNQFKEKYIAYSECIYKSINELNSNPPSADVYIAGSDQIWYSIFNYEVYRNILRAYFLDFGDENTKRISYAPSFGKDSQSDDFYEYIKPLLLRFSLVTVRELDGIKRCKLAGRNDSVQVLDPTMLLDRQIYSNISQKPSSKNYILLYLLGNKHGIDIDAIYDYAHRNSLEVKYIASQKNDDIRANCFPKVEEWIGLIENCNMMITNSFHGFVFSMLFNKKNIAVAADEDVRFNTLFNVFDIGDRKYDGSNLERLLDTCANYAKVNNKLLHERHRCSDLLINSIEK